MSGLWVSAGTKIYAIMKGSMQKRISINEEKVIRVIVEL